MITLDRRARRGEVVHSRTVTPETTAASLDLLASRLGLTAPIIVREAVRCLLARDESERR